MIPYENILPFSLLRGIVLHGVCYYFLVYLSNFRKHNLYYFSYLVFIFTFTCFVLIPENYFSPLDKTLLFCGLLFHNLYLKNILGEKNIPKNGIKYLNILNKLIVGFLLGVFIVYFSIGENCYNDIFYYGLPLLTLLYFPFYYYLFLSNLSIVRTFAIASIFLLTSVLYLTGTFVYDIEGFEHYAIDPVGIFYSTVLVQGLMIRFLTPKFILHQEKFDLNNQFMIAQKTKELNDLKISSLRSQMNPHFLFNSLNSMTSIVIKNDLNKIKTFIFNFTNLINNILSSTETREHRLVKELRTIKNYVELEKLRISGGFEFMIQIAENVDIRNTYVPPLVIQPYVENAIWHGILKSNKIPKKIKLDVYKEAEDLIIEVRDNGVGLEKALELTKLKKHKSLGTSINLDRIAMVYSDFDIQTIDQINQDNEWSTLVRVVLKSKV